MIEQYDKQTDVNELYGNEPVAKAFPIPEDTVKIQAANVTFLSDNPDIEQEYRENYVDLMTNGGRGKYGERLAQLADRARNAYNYALTNILKDDTVTMEAKEAAVRASANMDVDVVKEVAIKQAANRDESAFSSREKAVLSLTQDRLNAEMEYRDFEQKMKNIAKLKLDPTFKSTVSDVMEWFVPGSMTISSKTSQKKVGDILGIELGLSVADNKMKIRERLGSLPIEQRQQILMKMHDAIMNSSGVVFKDKNTLEGLGMIEELAVSSDYTPGSKLFENVVQVFDAVGLGSVIKGSVKYTTKFLNKAKVAEVVKTPSPISALPVTVSVNNEAGRTIYKAASKNNEIAKATSGLSKEDLVIHTEAPNVGVSQTEVEAKMIDPSRGIDPKIAELATQSGGLRFTEGEIESARKAALDRFKSHTNVTQYDNYTQVFSEGDSLIYRGFYGGPNMGFASAEEAINSAKFTFKDFGFKESDLLVYKRTPENTFERVALSDAKGVPGEYIIGVDAKTPVTVADSQLSPLTWKLNYFDRFRKAWSRSTGSITQNLLDAASVQPKLVTASAEVAADRSVAIEKAVLEKGDLYAKQAKALQQSDKETLLKAIVEGDNQRVNWTDLDLKHKFGLSDDAITAYKTFREAQDTNYWLSNLTTVKNYRNNGYKLFDNGTARLFGKEVQKALPTTPVYDPVTDTSRLLTRQELDDLYNRGGSLAKLRHEQEINGAKYSHFIVENTPQSYLRTLNDSDQIVNYLPGYFKRFYNSPRFVVTFERGSDGNRYERAVAIAGNWEDAQKHLEGLAASQGKPVDEVGRVRGDIKDPTEFELQAMSQAGMVNQRHRGKILDNAASPIYVGSSGNMLDPSESFIRAAASISNKVGMQDTIDTLKRRLMTQFEAVMPKDKSYPSSPMEIGLIGDQASKEARDARSLWQYIDSLEAGFYNNIDVLSREIFSQISMSAGKSGKKGVEKAAGILAEAAPMQTISSGLHRALITWNPLRQLIVQPAQAIRLSIYNPLAFGKAMADWNVYMHGLLSKRSGKALTGAQKELDDMVNRWGGLDGVDRSILVEGPLRSMSTSSLPTGLKEVADAAKTADKAMAAVGFDAGEKLNMFLHMATVRNEFKMLGKDVADARVQDEIFAKARALTLSLNQAGQMPYNRTALSLFTKFLQIPHKSLLQVVTNRRLAMSDKARLLGADILLYGVPVAAVSSLVGKDMLPEEPELRDKVEFGLLTHIYNKVLEDQFGRNPDANLSTLSPYEMSGWRNLFVGMMEDGFAATLAKTPAGTLTLGSNPRLSNAIRKLYDFMGQNGVEGDPVAFKEVVNEFAKIAGGYNNYTKAKYILETSKVADQRGLIIKEGVGNMEALHQLLGIPFKSVEQNFNSLKKMTDDTKNRKKDVEESVDRTLKLMHEKYQVGTNDFDQSIRIIQEFNRIFTDPHDFSLAMAHYTKRMKNSDDWLVSAMLKYAGFSSTDDLDIAIKSSGMSEERKDFMRNILHKDVPSIGADDFKEQEK